MLMRLRSTNKVMLQSLELYLGVLDFSCLVLSRFRGCSNGEVLDSKLFGIYKGETNSNG